MKIFSYKEWLLSNPIQKVASDLYGTPGYDIPKNHIGQMFRLLEHHGPGAEKMEARFAKLIRAVQAHPGATVPPEWLVNTLTMFGLPHLIKFMMPSYQGHDETVPENVPNEQGSEGGWQDETREDDTKTVKYDTGRLKGEKASSNQIDVKAEIAEIFKYASWFNGVRDYQEAKGVPFANMSAEDKEKALQILNADIANELNSREYKSEAEREEAINSAYRAIVYMMSLDKEPAEAVNPSKPATYPPMDPSHVEPTQKEVDKTRTDFDIPADLPIAMPVKVKEPKKYIGPPARKKPASRPLNFSATSDWLSKISFEDEDFVGQVATHSGREVRVMSFFYDKAGMGTYMIVRYMDTGSIDRIPANEVKMDQK